MRGRLQVVVAAALLFVGCYPGSDGEVFHRRWEADRRERVAGMKAATQQQARGAAVGGDALRALVAGRTHEFDYHEDPLGRAVRYIEYYHFQRDGRLLFRNPPMPTDRCEGQPRSLAGRRRSSLRHHRLAVAGRALLHAGGPAERPRAVLHPRTR